VRGMMDPESEKEREKQEKKVTVSFFFGRKKHLERKEQERR
jgi:hypothetical protein